MRTVAWLKAELSKFPDDAVCFPYEGEVFGIVIERPGPDGCRDFSAQGTIHFSVDDEYNESHETELLPPGK